MAHSCLTRLLSLPWHTDPAVKRRGRGFNPTSDGPAQDGVKTNASFDLIDSKVTETQEKAAQCK